MGGAGWLVSDWTERRETEWREVGTSAEFEKNALSRVWHVEALSVLFFGYSFPCKFAKIFNPRRS